MRGQAEGTYAYPFIDVETLGWTSVIATSVAIALLFLLAGFALVFMDRMLGERRTSD